MMDVRKGGAHLLAVIMVFGDKLLVRCDFVFQLMMLMAYFLAQSGSLRDDMTDVNIIDQVDEMETSHQFCLLSKSQ